VSVWYIGDVECVHIAKLDGSDMGNIRGVDTNTANNCEKCGLVLRIACRYVLLVYQIVCYLLAMRVAVGYGIGVHMVDNVGDSEVECLLLPCLRLTTDTYAAAAAAGGAAVSVNANMFWWWQYLWLSAVCTVVYVCECVLQLVPSLSSWFCTRR